MYDLTNEKSNNFAKRTRSLSPGINVVQPAEAIRSLRNLLRKKNNEVEQVEKQFKNSKKEIADLIIKLETVNEEKQSLNDDLSNCKKHLAN